jgi:hypothetical protein
VSPPPVARSPNSEVLIRQVLAITAASAALFTSVPALAATQAVLEARQHRQAATIHRYAATVRFFAHHRRLGRTKPGRRALRAAHIWLRVTARELAETRADLRAHRARARRARRLELQRSVLDGGWPDGWAAQAACIRAHEGWWTANTGNGYYGAYQFLRSTWTSVGGHGLPSEASPREQTYRAWLVWRRDGGSWREWSTAGSCGVY